MRFDDWMIATRSTNAGFGVRASVSGETVRRWRSGERDPDIAMMATIYGLTDGQVAPNDWAAVGPRTKNLGQEQHGQEPSEVGCA